MYLGRPWPPLAIPDHPLASLSTPVLPWPPLASPGLPHHPCPPPTPPGTPRQPLGFPCTLVQDPINKKMNFRKISIYFLKQNYRATHRNCYKCAYFFGIYSNLLIYWVLSFGTNWNSTNNVKRKATVPCPIPATPSHPRPPLASQSSPGLAQPPLDSPCHPL